ncbi:hypothetical protein Tco_0875794 [Tanacetum coccineum]|uniref:DUF4283 domain-containing protein n=1 Tax=Tanacetum coccineum TaxID=301880 RepID=A0ABQ5BTY8_9ASTR
MEGVAPTITGESGNAAMEVESPYVVEKTVEKEKLSLVEKDKLSFLDDTTVSEPFPPLSTLVSTAGNAPSKFSYANITCKPSGKKVNVRTLFTPRGNGIDVVVLVYSIRTICEQYANTTYGFFLGKKVAYPVIANYVRNTWGKYGLVRSMFSSSTKLFSYQFSSMDGLDAMLENGPWFIQNNLLILKKWHPDENLLEEDVSTIPVWVKLYGVPVTAFSEDGLSGIATKLADVELKDNIFVAMPKITREGHYACAGEKKTVKKPSQTSRGVPVGPKIGFKPQKEYQKEYRPVTKKPDASSRGNKKKGVEPTIECASNTPIGAKIDKIEQHIGEGKLRLLDNDGNPLVPMDESDKGYGTNSFLEQWRYSYPDNDDYDPYDDDMYENHNLSEHLQSICNDLDITTRGKKKK